MPLLLRRQGQVSTLTCKHANTALFTHPVSVAARGGAGGISRDVVDGKAVHCRIIRRIPKKNRGTLSCSRRHVGRIGSRAFLPSAKSLFHDHARKISRKIRFCMSKHPEAQIGVETSLTVGLLLKNDSPINLQRRKVESNWSGGRSIDCTRIPRL